MQSNEQRRRDLVRHIQRSAAAILPAEGESELSSRVVEAMLRVPRECFVPESEQLSAYDDCPLYIGHGQTISQPFIVALMTHLLDVGAGDRVLEVGTGSGYQAAVLAEIVQELYTMEVVRPLARAAQARFQELGYDNIHVMVADGSLGWPEHAPYDGVVVTAAGPRVPEALMGQLRPGGRLVMPVGEQWGAQWLVVQHKDRQGVRSTRKVIPVRFVPLTAAVVDD